MRCQSAEETAAQSEPEHPASSPASLASVREEKRIVTVLYADAGATFQSRPAADAEPEATLVQRFVRLTEDILPRYSGHLARSSGAWRARCVRLSADP